MREVLLNTLDSISVRWKFLLTASVMLTIINFVIGILGPFSPSALTMEESINYIAFGVLFLALALLIVAKGPKQERQRSKEHDRMVLSANVSMAFLSLFTGLVSLFFSIPTLEKQFGVRAGHQLFFRVHGIATAVGLTVGVVGVTISLLICKKIWCGGKVPKEKKTV